MTVLGVDRDTAIVREAVKSISKTTNVPQETHAFSGYCEPARTATSVQVTQRRPLEMSDNNRLTRQVRHDSPPSAIQPIAASRNGAAVP